MLTIVPRDEDTMRQINRDCKHWYADKVAIEKVDVNKLGICSRRVIRWDYDNDKRLWDSMDYSTIILLDCDIRTGVMQALSHTLEWLNESGTDFPIVYTSDYKELAVFIGGNSYHHAVFIEDGHGQLLEVWTFERLNVITANVLTNYVD